MAHSLFGTGTTLGAGAVILCVLTTHAAACNLRRDPILSFVCTAAATLAFAPLALRTYPGSVLKQCPWWPDTEIAGAH